MATGTGLGRGLLVGGDHVVVVGKGLALPLPRVQVEDAARLGLEVGGREGRPASVAAGALWRPRIASARPSCPRSQPRCPYLRLRSRYRARAGATEGPSAGSAARRRRPSRLPRPQGETTGGRPPLGRSSRPPRPCSKKRFRHFGRHKSPEAVHPELVGPCSAAM